MDNFSLLPWTFANEWLDLLIPNSEILPISLTDRDHCMDPAARPSLGVGWTSEMTTGMGNTISIAPRTNGTSPLQDPESSRYPPHHWPAVPPQGQAPLPPPHEFVRVGTITKPSDLKVYIIKTTDNGRTRHRCAYPNCSHAEHFPSERQVISHIRRVHIQEKPFMCTTCGKCYAHIQDAERHVNTKNNGKIHECTVCHKYYARRDYRDKHQKRHEEI